MTGEPGTAAPRVPLSDTWRSRRAWVVLLATLILGLAVDLATKYAAFRHVPDVPVRVVREEVLAASSLGRLVPDDKVVVIPSLLEFKLVLNPGAVFGMGAGRRWFFVAFTAVAVGFGLWMFRRWTRPREHAAHAAIGLLLAGGLGNLYDRVVYACVRDFIHPLPGVNLPFGWRYPWGGRELWPYVSNVADLFLLVGIGILIVHTWRGDKSRAQA